MVFTKLKIEFNRAYMIVMLLTSWEFTARSIKYLVEISSKINLS